MSYLWRIFLLPLPNKPTYNPPAPTTQRIYNPLLIIYVPSLTNWWLWGIGASKILYGRNQQIVFITGHLKIEMLPRYFGAYSRRLFKHATWGIGDVGCKLREDLMPRAKCFVKLVLHKVAGQNPHHKKSSTRWNTRSEGVGWNWISLITFLGQLIVVVVYRAACAYPIKWTLQLCCRNNKEPSLRDKYWPLEFNSSPQGDPLSVGPVASVFGHIFCWLLGNFGQSWLQLSNATCCKLFVTNENRNC